MLEAGAAAQRERLGEDHPVHLVAELNLATVLDERADAWLVVEWVHARRLDRYGAEHPLTVATATNLAGVDLTSIPSRC